MANPVSRTNSFALVALGMIVGMLGYLLFSYAKATTLPLTELKISQLGLGGSGAVGVEVSTDGTGVVNSDQASPSYTYSWNLLPTAVSMGVYVTNDTSSTKTAAVRFGAYPSTDSARACLTDGNGAIGGTKNISVGGNKKVFVNGGSYTPIPGAPVVIAACLVGSNNQSVGLVTLSFSTVLATKPPGAFTARNLTGAWDGFGGTSYTWNPCPPGYITAEDGSKFTCVPKVVNTQPASFLIPFIESAYAAPTARDCEDSSDNDGDGLVDWNGANGLLADDGCSGPSDNNEKTPARPTCNGNTC